MDLRNLTMGKEIPTESYSDQPYIAQTDNGAWLCVMTTGTGKEGESGQHVVSMRSFDEGLTWTDLVDVEPADGPEASYAVALKVPGGRIYCFYNHNTDNIREVKADPEAYLDGYCHRVDSLGHFVFKFSDDHGKTWSLKRYDIPQRTMEIDRQNPYEGKLKFFWNVGRPFIHDEAAYVPLHKVGGFGRGFFTRSEGILLKSVNLLTETNPDKIIWETLPDGDKGLRAPEGGGPIAEEQSFSVLSDGSFFCVYRTVDGHPACTYSRDCGYTWTEPQYMRYADGRLIKHPRAANFVWKCENGNYLYWFHNHGGRDYEDRNPVWLTGGIEEDTPNGRIIKWSQPEIILYDDDPYIRMSYPDLVEKDGRYYLTETQKDIARIHEIDPALIEGLWGQFGKGRVTNSKPVLSLPDKYETLPASVTMPRLPDFLERDMKRADHGVKDLRAGFSIELWIQVEDISSPQTVLDSRTVDGRGLCLRTIENGALEIFLSDGRTQCGWQSDPDMLTAGMLQHVVVTVDGGPKIITIIINGALCDGGDFRQFGWGRFSPNLRHVNGASDMLIAPDGGLNVIHLSMYDVVLRTSEAVDNYHVGLQDIPAAGGYQGSGL